MSSSDLYIPTDPLNNLIEIGIKHGIQVTFDHGAFSAAIQLIYSGIDTMASLGMPEGQQDVTKNDFVEWVEKYMRFPTPSVPTGLDLYGARCAMLHNHGVVSRLNRDGRCRKVIYCEDGDGVPVCFDPSVDPDLILLSVSALKKAFFDAIHLFLISLFSDAKRAKTAEERLGWLVVTIKRR